MNLLRRLVGIFARRPRSGYGAEVLFAGWVELPPGFREFNARRS